MNRKNIKHILCLSAILLMSQPHSSDAQEIISRKVISSDGYCGWPTVCQRSNGELIVVYSGDRLRHVDPWGKVRLIRSTDNGQTWSKPVIPVSTILDDRDAGLIELKSGKLMLFWFNSTAWFDGIGTEKIWDGLGKIDMPEAVILHTRKLPPLSELNKIKGPFSTVSSDGGKTWSPANRMTGSSPHGAVQLADGRILHAGRYLQSNGANDIVIEQYNERKDKWKLIATLKYDDGIDIKKCYEPHIIEVSPGGKIVVMARYQGKGSGEHMVQCESHDGGKHWTSLHKTSLYGYPPHLINLPDGRIMVTYARREAPNFGQYVSISDDGGETWGEEMLIDKGFEWDNGYPSTTLLGDGTFYTVYYGAPEPGAQKSVIAVNWKL